MKIFHAITGNHPRSIIAVTVLLAAFFVGATIFEAHQGNHGIVLAGLATAESATGEPADKNTPVQPEKKPVTTDKVTFGDNDKGIFFNDSMDSLAVSLKKKEAELKKREEALKAEEKRLNALRAEIEQNLARMDQTLKKMESLSAEADAKRQASISQWIEIYQTMAPEDVAKIVEGVDEDFAIRLLSEMEPKKAGEILSEIPPEISIKLSKYMTEKQ